MHYWKKIRCYDEYDIKEPWKKLRCSLMNMQALFRLLFLIHWRTATVKVTKEAMVFDNQTPALYCPLWSMRSQQHSLTWVEISIPNQIVISSFYFSCLFYDISVGILLICSLLGGWIFSFHLWIPIILHLKWGNVSKSVSCLFMFALFASLSYLMQYFQMHFSNGCYFFPASPNQWLFLCLGKCWETISIRKWKRNETQKIRGSFWSNVIYNQERAIVNCGLPQCPLQLGKMVKLLITAEVKYLHCSLLLCL